VLTGNPVRDALPEYKYFKRDVLKHAISEINMVTDINVELIEHKQGRRVAALQFRVTREPQESIELSAPPIVDAAVVQRMMALGLSQEDACNVLATTEDGKLRATLDLTENRIKNPKAAPIGSPAGYFRQALRDGYAANTDIAKKNLQKIVKKLSVEASIEAIKESYLVERAKDALGLFHELDPDVRDEWLSKFKQSGAGKGINLARGLATTSAKTAFSLWFAQQQWPDPTDSDLLAFAAVSGAARK
jgi:hypothetical protein